MSVRTALQIINQELDAYLASQEGEMDSDTRFCVAWYEQFGMNEAAFGEADVLARAKNTAVDRLVDDGVLSASKGKVRLLKRDELEDNWDPVVYKKDMIWMHTQQLVKTLEAEGEGKTAALVTKMRNDASERAKELAYRLYTIAERKGLTEEALAYNSLVVAWPDIQKKAAELSTRPYEQMDLF
jgi:putative DNA methylase